jgi:HPt (histidine-containing phosphotransfer) domain-containing protein
VNAMASSILNIDDLLQRVDNDRELLVELFGIFSEEFPGHLERLTEAIGSQQAAKLRTESHALKGMLLNLSARRAAAVAVELEILGTEKKLEGAKEALASLQAEVGLLLKQMDEYVSEFRT